MVIDLISDIQVFRGIHEGVSPLDWPRFATSYAVQTHVFTDTEIPNAGSSEMSAR